MVWMKTTTASTFCHKIRQEIAFLVGHHKIEEIQKLKI